MATPKGMSCLPLKVNTTDAVHLYSDATHIWLQLRRKIPTLQDIGKSSFKTAICLPIGTALKLGSELLRVAEGNKAKQKAKQNHPKAKQSSSTPPK